MTSSVSAKPTTTGMVISRRWAYPCAGSVLVEGSGDDVVMVTAEEEPDLLQQRLTGSDNSRTEEVDPIDWPTTLRTLSEKAKKLRKRVHDLKKLYVSIRLAINVRHCIRIIVQIGECLLPRVSYIVR
jgi:hypothetical protein